MARCAIRKNRRQSGKTPFEGLFFLAASTMLVMKGSPDVRQKSHPPLSSAGRRMGCTQGSGRTSGRAGYCGKRRGDAEPHEPARRFRLSRLRVAGSEAHVVVRVLRERRQGRRVGSHRQALHAGILRRPQRLRAICLERLRTGDGGPSHPPDGLRCAVRPLSSGELGRGLCA